MNVCHWASLSSFWNSLLLETPAILTIIEWNTVYYCLSITNLKDGFNGAIVFTSGAILIVLDLSNNTCFDRVLVDIAQKGREISQIVLASVARAAEPSGLARS